MCVCEFGFLFLILVLVFLCVFIMFFSMIIVVFSIIFIVKVSFVSEMILSEWLVSWSIIKVLSSEIGMVNVIMSVVCSWCIKS